MGERGRPDIDGHLMLSEANYWYRTGKGGTLSVELSKIDLSGIHTEDFMFVGSVNAFNLLLNSSSLNDGLVYRTITLRLYPNDMVRAFHDRYDFEMHSWWNPMNWPRNLEAQLGRFFAGEGTPFLINIRGEARIKRTHAVVK